MWKLAYHANCWGGLGGNAVGVTSITQLTYRTFGDMERAINEIGACGYEGVELFDGNLLDYARNYGGLRKICSNAGVKFLAAYSGANFIFHDILAEELKRIERAAAAAAEMGAEHFVVGGGAKRASGTKRDDVKHLAASLEKVVRIAKKLGLQAHYHPHLTTIVEGPKEVSRVFKETSIHFCPDTAHLAAAGGDPAQLIRDQASRISYVHLKGFQREPFAFTPLDRGDIPTAPILKALKDTGYQGWVCAELDAWPDPAEGARLSMSLLKA